MGIDAKFDMDLADADPDGLADNNDSSGATLTLDGALTSGGTFTSADGFAHRLDIIDTATQDQSGSTFNVTGTDENDNTQTEAVVGPASGATVESTKYFKTVTSVTITNPTALGTVDMGTVDEVMSPIYVLDRNSPNVAAYAVMGLVGTCVFDIDITFDNILAEGSASANWFEVQADQSADLNATAPQGASGIRLGFDSYTNGAELQFHVIVPVDPA